MMLLVTFCSKVTKGGIFRAKQHLVGGFRNATMCKKCPTHVREELQEYMQQKASAKTLDNCLIMRMLKFLEMTKMKMMLGQFLEAQKEINLVSLKEINLGNSKHLTAFPDLSQAKNLDRLNFEYCTSLVEVPSSIRFLDKLVDMNMRCCTSLTSLPSGIKLRSLKTLNFSGCLNLRKCPEVAGNINYLNLNEIAIEELPKSIGHLSGLIALNLRDCKRLSNPPGSIRLLKSLMTVDLSGCSNITLFPDISGDIRYLYLRETAIEETPSSIGCLSRLSCLDLKNCTRLKNLPSTIV
ncbi:hypothetical protein GH714_001722 [Hevea brasiliensis]|uniref:Disease resistance protein RPS4B/Roq1-like leucine-rich repeats domain-containing protein n=1 Tax=Hevea brasiliensis TaxID=3981 RepID=A0A6A6M9Z5_HEVBR|nr:hypothetical protein GH714_001722 [Hevea brasiliensis]